jgi:hypothetical protein
MEPQETSWHELTYQDAKERLDHLNTRLQEAGYHAKFRLVIDQGWDVIFDDNGELEIEETVEDAERIVEELCG